MCSVWCGVFGWVVVLCFVLVETGTHNTNFSVGWVGLCMLMKRLSLFGISSGNLQNNELYVIFCLNCIFILIYCIYLFEIICVILELLYL